MPGLSFSGAAFIPAFKHTSIANVSLIYAAAPFVAALLAWLWMRERPALVVVFASLGTFVGVALIVSGSSGSGNIKGDALALWMTLMMAAVIVIYRRFPETPGPGPMALSCVILLPVSLYFGSPSKAPLIEILIMASFGLVFAVASVALVLGSRFLPSSETALISTLEAPLAIFFAWMMFAEVPVITTVAGGVIILTCVIGSQMFLSRRNSDRRPSLPGR
jgi:drug/metabolite transporter (DMT)-like permease